MNVSRNLLASSLLAVLSLGAAGQTPPAAPGAAAAASGAQHPHRPDPARMQEYAARRQAALKQKLQITPAQESAWAAYLEAMKPPPADMMAMMGPQRAELEKLSTPERIDRMRAIRTAHMAEMDRRGEATKAFYAALTPEQRKVFDAHTAPRARGMPHHHQHHGGAGQHRS